MKPLALSCRTGRIQRPCARQDRSPNMKKTGKTKAGAGAAKAPVATAKATRNRPLAATKLAELKRRLLEISDLAGAGAVLGWDQSTYMPIGGAHARARQGATLSRLAHEKSVDSALGKLLDALEPYAAGLPYDSDEASLIRIARRDFEKAIKLPSAYVARASALGSASYDAWTRARPANDCAAMLPFLEKAVDLSREYAGYYAPYKHVADPLIDAADEGMTADLVRSLFAETQARIDTDRARHFRSAHSWRRLPAWFFQRVGAAGF